MYSLRSYNFITMGVTNDNRELFYYGYIEDELDQLEHDVNEQENDNETHHLQQRKKKNAHKNRGKYGSYGKQHDHVAYGIKRRTGAREARRCENTKHLLSLIEKEDGSEIEMELFETSMSAFAELFMEQEKMKIWNDFVNSSEEEQESMLRGKRSECQHEKEDNEESWEEIPDLRTAHPAYTAKECYERIEKKIKTFLKRRHVPVYKIHLHYQYANYQL
ncbi:hypothetical protein KUTeg_017036 [Tegillarca granosa]|uniref:R3H-associated N-terminal domain-containing protein n=1 Tax=Tegillarca granosa TaxID=220873 RepID=A0ABQ9ERF2_TEGGR|nr:hypothetical protein KUTeg_017036 [Tegillarca granosa]